MFELQIVEINLPAIVGVRRSVDHARGAGGQKLLAQAVRKNEVRHVIGREGELQAVFSHLALPEHRARVVDQHVDARLGRADFGGQAVEIAQARNIAVVNRVRLTWSDLSQAGQCRLAAVSYCAPPGQFAHPSPPASPPIFDRCPTFRR